VIAYAIQAPSLGFYHDGPVRRIDDSRLLAHVLRRWRLVFVASDDAHAPEVLAAGTFYRWGRGRHVLLGSRPPPTSP
jgi:hypothetical protein